MRQGLHVSMSSPVRSVSGVQEMKLMLIQHYELIWEMTRREISERYAGQILGTIWAVGHPLLLMSIYVFVFGVIYPSRIRMGAELPYSFALYILAGLIPWLAFSEAMAKGTTVITNYSNLVKQVVFPIEILPVKGVLVASLTQGVATLGLFMYMLVVERYSPGHGLDVPFAICPSTLRNDRRQLRSLISRSVCPGFKGYGSGFFECRYFSCSHPLLAFMDRPHLASSAICTPRESIRPFNLVLSGHLLFWLDSACVVVDRTGRALSQHVVRWLPSLPSLKSKIC